jgi:hypothetical protein
MTRHTCPYCEERKPRSEFILAQHFAGGSYRRAGRLYDRLICADCALKILDKPEAQSGSGHRRYDGWAFYSLRIGMSQWLMGMEKEKDK